MPLSRVLLLIISFVLSLFCLKCGGASNQEANPDTSLSSQSCGNKTVETHEACDDGNTNNSDGCNSHCAWEVGEAVCANGVLENDECCDDGNNISGDGCSSTCTSEKNNRPPTPPVLSSEPHNGAFWAATRLYLSWNPSTDPDPGDLIVYDIYFGKGQYEGSTPYKRNVSSTHFIIQASTDNRAQYFPDLIRPFYLEPNSTYTWKVCARDRANVSACSEIRIFNTDDSIIGWWRFDEDPAGPTCSNILGGPAGDAGETICDYSGKGNHGIPQGQMNWIPPLDSSVILGAAIDFNERYIVVPNSSSLNPANKLTIETIQNLRNFGNTTDRPLLSKLVYPEASDNTGYGFSFGNGTDLYLWIGNRIVGRSFVGTLNEWEHLIATYDGSSSNLYENGLLLSNQALSGPIQPNTNPLWLGHSIRSNSFYSGQISEIIIYSRDLSGAEVKNSFMNFQERNL